MNNNETVFEVKIKLRGDGVYDIYSNDKWVGAAGSVDNTIIVVTHLLEKLRDETKLN